MTATKFSFPTPMGMIEFTLEEQVERKLAGGGTAAVEQAAEMVKDIRILQARLHMAEEMIGKQNALLVKANGETQEIKNSLERIEGMVKRLLPAYGSEVH